MSEATAYGSIAALGIFLLVLFSFGPIADVVHSAVKSATSVAEFTNPLQRTIAEQGVAGTVFTGQLGFVADTFNSSELIKSLLTPLSELFNFFMSLFTSTLSFFGSTLTYQNKDPALFLNILGLLLFVLGYSFYKELKNKNHNTYSLLFFFLIFPVALIGLLKTKYSIYLAYVVSISFGVLLGELDHLFSSFELPKVSGMSSVYLVLILAGSYVVYLQWFGSTGYAGYLIPQLTVQRFQDNPSALQARLSDFCTYSGDQTSLVCQAANDPVAYANKGINYQFNSNLCLLSVADPRDGIDSSESIAMQYRCSKIADYWIDLYDWMRTSTPKDARFTSWWDYGHWTIYFGQRSTVIRNDHSFEPMIEDVAYGFIIGTPDELRSIMLEHGSNYVFFDKEILFSGRGFGGKYGALNYLACARAGETTVANPPGTSACEAQHLWEEVYVPNPGTSLSKTCTVSELTNKTGVVAYSLDSGTPKPAFCLSDAVLADGKKYPALYYLDKKTPSGDLQIKPALLQLAYSNEGYSLFQLVYVHDKLWPINGTYVDGFSDHKSKFYDSVLYNGFVLGNIPGFDLVYQTENGEVKVFKISSS